MLIAGHGEIVNALLAAKADVNTATKSGWTALMAAAEHGDLSVVKALLERGVRINATTYNGLTALMKGAAHGHAEVVKLLQRELVSMLRPIRV